MHFEQAICRETDPEIFFPAETNAQKQHEQTEAAKAICRRCAHTLDCARYAIRNRVEYGIWGGLTPGDRMTLLFEAV